MANETRPRRESSSTSRIRKAAPLSPGAPAPASTVADENGLSPSVASPSSPDSVETPVAAGEYRERVEREPYPQERPADREPIRYVRDRALSTVRHSCPFSPVRREAV